MVVRDRVVAFRILFVLIATATALMFLVAHSPAPTSDSVASIIEYDGIVEVRGNEPFTYAVFITGNQVFEISGPLKAQLIAHYQQYRVRVHGYVAQHTSNNEPRLAVLIVEKILNL